MKPRRHLAACAMAALLALGSAARAGAPLDDRVPQDAILYIGWAGADALASQYAASNLKGIVDASAARQFINQQLPKLIDMAARQNPQAPQIIAKLQTGLDIAWRHPAAIYVCPVDFSDPRRPELRMGLVIDAGTDAKSLADLLGEALTKLPPQDPGQPPVLVASEGTLVAVTIGKAESFTNRGKNGGLAAAPSYIKAMAQMKVTKPAVTLFVDIGNGLAATKEGLDKVPDLPTEAKKQFAVITDALGLNSLTQIASAAAFDGKEWSEQTFVGINGPRQGLLAILGTAPLSDGILNVIPKNAVSFGTLKLDPHQIFSEIRAAAGKIDPAALDQFDDAVAESNKQTGMNLERDVLAPLGDEWVFYRAPLSDIGGNSFALVHKLRDHERFAGTVSQIEDMLNTAGKGQFKIDRLTAGKIQFASISFLQYSLAWTVRGDYFYASSIEGLPGAVKQVENKLPSIAENDLYKKAMAALPAGIKPLSISYSNPAKTYPELRRLALGIFPLARANGIDLPANLLPDIDDISPFMAPGASISWLDNDGLHIAGRSAFPGAEILGGNPRGGPTMVAAMALATAAALPAIGNARDQAKRVTDAVNLKAIGTSFAIYAASNANQSPEDIAHLVANDALDPRFLVSPRIGTVALVMTPELHKLATDDFPKFADQVALHCDYIYIAKEMSMLRGNASALIIAYDKPNPALSDGINAVFLDGHVEFTRWNRVAELFGPTNDFLKSKGLPPIDTDDMLRKAGQLPPLPARPGGLP